MLRVADAYAAAVVDADPGCSRGGVHECVQQGPISDCVGAVQHAFRLSIRRGDRTSVEVIAADDDRRRDFAATYQLIDGQAELGSLAVAEPANASRQALKVNSFASQLDPTLERLVFRKEGEHQLVGLANVFRIARKRHPAERPFALAK